MTIRHLGIAVALLLLAVGIAAAQAPQPSGAAARTDQAKAAAPLDQLGFLVGDWVAVGSGAPGESQGEFSFKLDLQDRVMIRRNTSRSGEGTHEDLMVIYLAGDALKAFYLDSEGHAIHYKVTVTTAPRRAVFLSEEAPGAPRFRLTYSQEPDGPLNIAFDVAGPGGEFKPYVSGTARRK